MSNLINKYGAATPTRAGVITPALTDLSNVASTHNPGVLAYNSTSSEWESQRVATISRTVFYHWRLVSTSSLNGNANYTYDNNDNTIWHNAHAKILDSTYVSRVVASGSLVPVATSGWTQYWTLKASGLDGKRIRLEALHFGNGNPTLGSTDEIVYQWGQGSSNLATYTPLGNKAYQTAQHTQVAIGEFTMGSSDVNVALKVVSVSGSVSILRGGYGGATSAYASYVTLSILEG